MSAVLLAFPAIMGQLGVVKRIWVDGADRDPPRLEVQLSNGAYVLVGWDSDYSCRSLFYAPTKEADFVSCVGGDTGLSIDVLGALCDEVEAATRAHDSNDRAEYEADAGNFEDGQ